METIILHSSIAEVVSDFAHPGLKSIRFVFTDDKPNANAVGIEYEDFPELIKSATGTPIKMRFLGKGVGGHERSIPVGFIQRLFENKLDDGTNQLIAEGTLFSEEYPDEMEWLASEHEAGKAPGISWELSYHSKILKDGVNWLKGIITRAATFVSNPAYGMRTAILALASDSTMPEEEFISSVAELLNAEVWTTEYVNSLPDSSFACVNKSGRHYPYKNKEGKIDLPHLRNALSRIGDSSNEQCGMDKLRAAAKQSGMMDSEIDKLSPKNTTQGGNSIMEEEIKTLKEQLKALEAQVSDKDTEIARLTSDNDALTTSLSEKDQTISEFQNKELIASRTKALSDAGITVDIKSERLVKMDDEDFTAYIADLKSAAESAAEAAKKDKMETASSRTGLRIPRFDASASTESTEPSTLAEKLRGISRTRPEATE